MLKPTAIGFDTVFQRELELIAKRRKHGDSAPAAALDLWGLALSGGGIRSAAFNLGLLQALAKHDVLQRCDYLSTVSGGGYIGACLSSLTATGPADATSGGFPFDVGGAVERPEVAHLREHSEYLVPRAGLLRLGTWRAISTYLGGLLFTLLTGAGMLAIAAALAIAAYPPILAFVRGLLGRSLVDPAHMWTAPREHLGELFAPALAALALWVLASLLYLVSGTLRRVWTLDARARLTKVQGGLLMAAGAGAVFGAVPLIMVWIDGQLVRLAPAITLASILSALTVPGAFFLSAQVQAAWDKVRHWVLALGIWAFVTIVWIAVLYIVWLFRDYALPIAGGIIVLLWLVSRLTDINRISMYYFYRDRLSETFVVRRDGDRIEGNDGLRLTSLAFEDRRVPYHLINTTVNLPGSEDLTLRGRQGDFFLFSPLFCGSRITGYSPTTTYERGRVSLASAMAVSGAAANPQHGHGTSPGLAFLMTLLNVRLGIWSEHPAYSAGFLSHLGRPRDFWPVYLLFELLSLANEKRHLVSLSDGGHIENLGAYELLRRRCRTVIVSDAAADPHSTFGDLARLLRTVRIDHGVEVSLKVDRLRTSAEKPLADAHVEVGEIVYPPLDAGQPDVGQLYYVKAGLTAQDPPDLHHYRTQHPTFPHESTTDQFFDEAQFESYRLLGYESGRAVVQAQST